MYRTRLNDRLVRGLDYYTRTAFEFTHGALGAQNAILGGGRYDGLSEALGGPPAPGIGFAIGEDRLVLALKQTAESVQAKPDVYIAPMGAGMNREVGPVGAEYGTKIWSSSWGMNPSGSRNLLKPPTNWVRASP